ncbi:MAG TPA: hypothetical protein DCO72_10680 [Ruminococcus sp.]|nr:hypothetical protein [Ruminococcus sp.]
MKKVSSILTMALITATALTAVPFQVSAEEVATTAVQETQPVQNATEPVTEAPSTTQDPAEIPSTGTIYGTMQIPYADFFKAEFEEANNSDVEVDAVSSATANKWKGNAVGSFDEEGNWTQGGLAAGTYYEEAEVGGKILGVVYPVAIQAENYEFLKDNYSFTPNADMTAEPTAYKTVTVDGENVTFSKINDTDGVQDVGGSVTLQTQTNYGDYQIQVENFPKDADTYGAIVKTTDGNYYAMRALENIWRNGQYAWSVGYVTQTHGNNIDNEDYHSTNGATIDEIVMITLDGYRVVKDVNLYLPEIFTAGVEVKDSTAGTGAVTADVSAFPADYQAVGTVADGFTVTFADGVANISYQNAQPAKYNLTISDESGKYANVKGTFTLSTDSLPVAYDGEGKIVPAEGYTQEDADNFIKNITSVQVGENTYNTGRRGTTIITADGTIDKTVQANNTPVFVEGQNYDIVVNATGYNTPLKFNTGDSAPVSTTTTTTTTSTTTTSTTTTTKATTTTTKSNSSSSSSSSKTTANTSSSSSSTAAPKTGDPAGAAPFVALAGIIGLVGFTTKKNKK